jgi:phosphatidylglycerol---prolipoprotein diacylglyceryl transferase
VTLGFDPPLIQIGALAVRPFGLLSLVGLALGLWITLRPVQHDAQTREAVLRALAWAVPVGVVSARLVHVLGWWDYYLMRPGEVWRLGIDGLSLWGGLVGGGLAAPARLRGDVFRRRRIFDLAVPGVALGIAVGRFGAFLEGAGQGIPSDLPWATQYTSRLAATPDFGVTRHPAQMYDALVALALAVVLTRLRGHIPLGLPTALFLALYGVARLALGSVRLEPAFLFGMQIEQLLALGALAVGVRMALRNVSRVKVTLLSKGDCHLCDAALTELRRLQGRYPHQLEVVDITSDAALQDRYGERIPVVQVDGREYAAPLTRAVLERALSGRA